MSGFIQRYSRAFALGIVFFVATFFFAGFANPGHAAAAGEIKGGKYYFEAVVNSEKVQFFITPETTKVSLKPVVAGLNLDSNAVIPDDGMIHIKDVPAGTYSLTLDFNLTKAACESNWLQKALKWGATGLPGILYCKTRSGMIISGSRTFTNIKVDDGGVANIETDITSDKKAAPAIQTDENGNPKLNCEGDFLVEWVLCPIVENMFGAMDFMLKNVMQPFLAVAPLLPTGADGKTTPLYNVWDNIRNIVNLLFILVFFVIIFSQVTSIGVSNYGVKKLLPRLIGIAILSNISFFICAILVDISNILGAGVASLLTTSILNGQPTVDLSGSLLLDGAAIGVLVSALPLAILALPAIFIFIVIGFIFFAMAAFLVLLRQVLLIFLIAVSPLAMLAGILPNTSRLASRWFNLFLRILMLYPIIMMLFAVGKIASSVLTQVGGLSG